MNLLDVMHRFPTEESCIAHLESIRWGNTPQCPYCESSNVARKKEKDKIGRWNCHECKSSFNVLAGTVFQGTHIVLQKWFVGIALIANAKKGLSSYQLSRDIDLNQRSAWYMMTRIRAEMQSNSILLQGIIEADETYIGGKPRKHNLHSKRHTSKKEVVPNKRGRGTRKSPVLGVIQHGGEVVAQLTPKVTGKAILEFIKKVVDTGKSTLMTDEFASYNTLTDIMSHNIVNHSKGEYVSADGQVHTNTIEGFWSLLKRAWYGTHHHYKKEYLPLYLAEQCYKYNNRNADSIFEKFLRECFP